MDTRFQVDYQTIDQTKRMHVSASDQGIAKQRAEEYLKLKYGEIFTIVGIEQIAGPELHEHIAAYVMKGNFYRYDCQTEQDAIELEDKISAVFKRESVFHKFMALRFEKAVHVCPIRWVKKEDWEKPKEQDLGWYGRNQ